METLLMTGVCFCFYMLYRNERVHRFRIDILDRIVANPETMYHNLAIFDSVEYDTMMKRFWRPLTVKAWYKGMKLG